MGSRVGELQIQGTRFEDGKAETPPIRMNELVLGL
jgi:hypothetical protein